MRICKFEIKNFKGIQNAAFEWQDIVVFIGENNASKSSVLQALQLFLSGSQVKDPAFFWDNLTDLDHAIELTAHFCDLSEIEQAAGAVRGRMVGQNWVLKKKFWSEAREGREQTWREQYYSYSPQEVFANWPNNEGLWANFPPEYGPYIGQLPLRGPRTNSEARDQVRDLVRQQNPRMINHGEPTWFPNPGGGGNWKSNANSVIPRCIYIKAVHDSADEVTAHESSSYGKIVSLIIEKRLRQRREVVELKYQIENVMRLFTPDPEHPEAQAEEIRDVQERINARLNQVIGGTVSIRTRELEVESMLLPKTFLVLRDRPDCVETPPVHQGHGLQRTLIMTLLQILAEIEREADPRENGEPALEISPRSVVLAIEEPELYMHPQMERKMRDVLYGLATQAGFQVICTTHSPVFLDIANSHKSIVRVAKRADRQVNFFQVSDDIFGGPEADPERERVRLMASFHPTINEVFFAKHVVLLEEYSAAVAFEKGAELTGLFVRHPHLRHDVMLVDCHGKGNIPMFQRVLNRFDIPYTVVHDEDRGNPLEERTNGRIAELSETAARRNPCHAIAPANLEGLLNYEARSDKPYQALRRVEELHRAGRLPEAFLAALNWAFFGDAHEPVEDLN